jgi:ABC-type multidrug transport system fused ATPase/permease subunit
VALIAVSAILGVLSVAWPVLSKGIVDSLVGASWLRFVAFCLGILGAFLAQMLLGYLANLLNAWVSQDWTVQLRERCFGYYFRSALSRSADVGDALSTIISDCARVGSLVLGLVSTITSALAALVGALIAMSVMSPSLLAISTITIPLLALVYSRWAQLQRECSNGERLALARLTGSTKDGIENSRVLTGLGGSYWAAEGVRGLLASYTAAIIRTVRVSANLGVAASLVGLLAQGAVLGYGGLLYFRGLISLGTLFAFSSLSARVQGPIAAFYGISGSLNMTAASIDRVTEAVNNTPVLSTSPVITSRRAGQVVDSIRRVLLPGRCVGLVGPVGCGKSTVCLALMLRLWSQGDGYPAVAYIPQNASVPRGTFRNILSQGSPEVPEPELHRALSVVGLAARVGGCAEGLDTRIGSDGLQLSAGEIQKLLLARAMVMDCQLLILDESLSSLDADSAVEILREIRSRLRGLNGTMLLVTHRREEIDVLDEVYELRRDRLFERSRTAQDRPCPGLGGD